MLSINNLNQILHLKLTPEFVRRGRKMSDELVKEIMDTALHEAAHLVAAIACNSSVQQVQLSFTEKGGAGGVVRARDKLPEHAVFVTAAGPAWDSQYYEPVEGEWWTRCEPDIIQGLYESIEAEKDWAGFLYVAKEWVFHNEDVITQAAIGILGLSPKSQGPINSAKRRALVKWLRPRITPYPVAKIAGLPGLDPTLEYP